MEFLKENWYYVLGAVVVLYLLMNRSGGTSITQIGSSEESIALGQLAYQEREADEARRFGLATSLLNYDLSLRNLGLDRMQMDIDAELGRTALSQQIDLARISAQSNANAFANQLQLATMQDSLARYNSQLEFDLQMRALRQQSNQQARADWIGAIGGGLQTALPYIFGAGRTGSGGYGTPPIFPTGWSI